MVFVLLLWLISNATFYNCSLYIWLKLVHFWGGNPNFLFDTYSLSWRPARTIIWCNGAKTLFHHFYAYAKTMRMDLIGLHRLQKETQSCSQDWPLFLFLTLTSPISFEEHELGLYFRPEDLTLGRFIRQEMSLVFATGHLNISFTGETNFKKAANPRIILLLLDIFLFIWNIGL